MTSFFGEGSPLTQNGFSAVNSANGIESAALWAVLSVETSGCGYLPDRRPKILFERHIFSKLTQGRYDSVAPDISAPTPGGYGDLGANQYSRLGAAIQLDSEAALQSASWGLGQIMGENFSAAGFPSVDAMVAAMVASEDAQLAAMTTFVKSNGMVSALQQHDWTGFARNYNGPNYGANNYDGKLQNFYQQYVSGNTPDLQVRAAQMYLTYKGFSPGPIDGVNGDSTLAAVEAFQTSIGEPASGIIDDTLIILLQM